MNIRTTLVTLCLATSALLPGAAFASHNDTALIGLRVTVASVVGGTVTVTVSGTGSSSSALSSMRLGPQFFYDNYGSGALDRWTQAGTPPAIDWGDGNSLANTGIPFTFQGSSTGGSSVSRFSGQFVHTYATGGTHTIRAFGTNIYASANSTLIAGNHFSQTSPGLVNRNSTTTNTSTRFTGLGPIGVTNTAQAATVSSVPVPSTSGFASTLLGLLLALVGVAVIRRG